MNIMLTARCCPQCFIDLERMFFTLSIPRSIYLDRVYHYDILDLMLPCGVCRTCDIVEFDDIRLLEKIPLEVEEWAKANIDSLVNTLEK
jgi:hypothetical protein